MEWVQTLFQICRWNVHYSSREFSAGTGGGWYVPVANTPQTPKITSSTHVDSNSWYKNDTAILNWTVPNDIVAVRTLLDTTPSSIPTKVYNTPINTITLDSLPEGELYFHLQFKNENGWGKVAHYRLAVDSKSPTLFTITSPEGVDFSSPNQTLLFETEDETSGVKNYKIKIDEEEPVEFIDIDETGEFTLPSLSPGYHSIVAEAIDGAGNALISTYSFTITAFDKPTFTEYPNEINDQVIPVIKGMTRPGSDVNVFLKKVGANQIEYNLKANESGEFVFIPESTLSKGVYELEVVATDAFGAVSERSESIRIAVQEPGFVRIGSYVVDILSVIVPLVGTLTLLAFLIWYTLLRFKRYRKRVQTESTEAIAILKREFTELERFMDAYETELVNSRRTKKLTKAEDDVVTGMKSALSSSKYRIEKELNDIDELNK
ncbi:MAG: Ig-like domain-containing protein [Candidatus Paceibacterota bacterium]